ncbi:hypothetical protein [Martelella alba]|uniref:Phage protein Gp138 N-terminal domain-containing protein n=1 Tax=Martelella alba TaxID=2590451 RepID=A0ABY2SRX8_9HYPH|nr:hypothetical protein [Martelella alba]TKI08338.1 hypothetical protein FCN80_04125 [Martelella alba]
MSVGQKTPLALSLNQFSERKILDAIQLLGKSLPAIVVSNDNSIVTVSFQITSQFTLPNVTMPLFGPEYVRYPIQPGCKGLVIPSDFYLGGISGLGGGVAGLDTPANLSALVFLPISNTAWSNVDMDAVTVYGPNGVVLRDESSNTIFTLTPDSITMVSPGSVKATVGGTSFELTPSAWALSGQNGSLTDETASTSPETMHNAWAALITWLNSHTHSDDGSGPPSTPFSGGSIAP